MQIFRRLAAHVKFHQIRTLIAGSFCWKYMKFKLKKYRGVMSHDPENWCKIWRKTDLLFQKWHEFGDFWPKHSKASKICIFIGFYCPKYLKFDLKMYGRVIFHDTEQWYKIWRGIDLSFQNWHEEFEKIDLALESLKNFHFNGLLLNKAYIVWAKKVQRSYLPRNLRVLQNLTENWLVVWKMTLAIWQVFTRALESVKITTLMGSFCPE